MGRRPEEPACPHCGQALEADVDGDLVCADCLYVAPLETRLDHTITRLAQQLAANMAILRGKGKTS